MLGSSSIAIKCAFKDFMKAISSQMPSNALNCSRQASRALLICPGSLSRAIESIRGHLRTNSFHKVFKSAFDGNQAEAEHEAPDGGHQARWMLPSMKKP